MAQRPLRLAQEAAVVAKVATKVAEAAAGVIPLGPSEVHSVVVARDWVVRETSQAE